MLLAALLLLSLVAAPTSAAALSRGTSDVPSFMLHDEPVHCKNCMNGMPMDGQTPRAHTERTIWTRTARTLTRLLTD
jgi:hypothetical protein